jgi:hypothetical protein
MTTQRITKSLVDRLKSGCIVWDDDCRGFGVRRQVRDASYVLKVRVHGRQRFLTIGKHGAPWTPETARMRARRLLAEIAEGKDPAAVRDARRAALNFKEFSDRYLNEHALPRKKPRSVEEDRRNLRLHIWPELAKRRLTDITELDIARLHAKGKSVQPMPIDAWRYSPICLTSRRSGASDREGQTLALISTSIQSALENACCLQTNSLASATRYAWRREAIQTISKLGDERSTGAARKIGVPSRSSGS